MTPKHKKCHVIIAGSVIKSFESSEKEHRPLDGMKFCKPNERS